MVTPQYGFLSNKNLIGLWDKLYEPTLNGVWATQIGTVVNSSQETEDYGWLGAAPGLDLMTADNPTEEQFGKFRYYLRNQEYAKAIKIAQKDMRRDKLGQIEMRIGEMGEKAAEHWNTLAAATLIANPNGYDGVSFFSTAHAESGVSQVNDVSATQVPSLNVLDPTSPTGPEMAAALSGVIGSFYTLTDDKGDAINGQAKDFTVLTGNQIVYQALQYAATATTFGAGQSNQIIGLTANGTKVNVLLIPRLYDAGNPNRFYVFRNDSRVKALLLQEEVAIDPAVSDETNDEYIKFRRFIFSLYTSRAVGVARWQAAMRATLS